MRAEGLTVVKFAELAGIVSPARPFTYSVALGKGFDRRSRVENIHVPVIYLKAGSLL